MDAQQVQHVRQQALALIERARTDASFIDQLKADPTAALQAAGLPESAVAEFVIDVQQRGILDFDVAGYGVPVDTCDWTFCGGTCSASR